MLALAAVVRSTGPSRCVFNEEECSCSKRAEVAGEKCITYNGIGASGGAECSFGACNSERFTCDCLEPTHLCTRTTCTHWKALEESAQDPFKCVSEMSSCVQKKSAFDLAPVPPVTASVTTTAATTTQTTTQATTTAATTIAPTTSVAADTTTSLATTTEKEVATEVRSSCQFPCPKCYVPSSNCERCILDTSMSPAEAAECNPCENGGDEYCGPMFGLIGDWKCCPPSSVCKHDILPSRGIGRATPHLICSDHCDSECDSWSSGLCSPFGHHALSNDAVGKYDDIGDCSWQDL